ncbi:MAG: hypothetical protein RR502_05220 [Oscillospiraceae bacterium]
MRKFLKITLCLLAFILAVGGAVALWQWDNISALRDSLTMSAQTVDADIVKNDQQLKDVMNQYHIEEHTFSKEELDAITGDDATLDSAAETVLNNSTSSPAVSPSPSVQVPPNGKPAPSVKPSVKPDKVDYTKQIRAQIAKMYVLKATYVSALEGIVANTKAEYLAVPVKERTVAKKQAIVTARAGELSALEKECDRKVATVVTELRKLLKADGQDGSTADLVETTYANEKRLKKTYYIQEFTS